MRDLAPGLIESKNRPPVSASNDHGNVIEDFAKSIYQSGIENTVNGVVQLLPFVHPLHISALEPAEPTSGLEKFSEQVGNVFGMLVPFAIAHYGVGRVASMGALKFGADVDSIFYKTTHAAATGLAVGALFTPTEKGQDWTWRFKNGAIDAGTFAAMTFTGTKLAGLGVASARELPLIARVVRSSLIGLGSGIPGGFVNAGLTAASGRHMGLRDVAADVAGFSAFCLVGGAFGAFDGGRSGSGATRDTGIEERFPKHSADSVRAVRARVVEPTSSAKVSAESAQFKPALTDMSSGSPFDNAAELDAYDDTVLPHEIVRQATAGVDRGVPENSLLPPRIGSGVDEPPIPSYRTKNGLWFPRRSIDAWYSEEEIARGTDHLSRQYVLGQPEVRTEFAERMQKIVKSWEPTNEELRTRLEEVKSAEVERDRLRGGYEKAKDQVARDLEFRVPTSRIEYLTQSDRRLKLFLRSDEAKRLGINDIEGKSSAVESFYNARVKVGLALMNAEKLIEPRIQQLQALLDDTTERHGLFHVTVKARHELSGYGRYPDGAILFRAELFVHDQPHQMTDTIYHELTHHEQLSLTVRHIADLLHVGPNAGANELAAVTKEYISRSNYSKLDRTALINILETRNGQPLSDDQARAADDLLSVRLRRPRAEKQQYSELGNLFRSLNSKAKSLSGENAPSVVQRILKNDAGSDTLPSKLNVRLPDNMPENLSVPKVQLDPSDLEASRQSLLNGIRQWQDEINKWRETSYTKYMGTKIEWDAWLNGELAMLQAEKAALTNT